MSLRPPPQHPTRTPSGTRLATPSISQPSTPPLPPRPGQSPGSDSPNLTVPFSSEPPISSTAPPPAVDDDISEAELREQYEDEEIQRFLTFFSAHVTEVRVPGSKRG
ncbi:hypothetical protein OF83DRAFT_39000 [Amylostereum chailletii]|nr:hypothetical protein OF83DRAFT_39000 [Amylostereum chailletii]